MAGLSIVITAWNKQEVLPFVLSSLMKQKMWYGYEVLVLNDGLDNDGTKEICTRYTGKLPIRYIFTGQRNKPNNMVRRATVSAINIGIKQAKNPIIVLQGSEVIHLSTGDVMNLVGVFTRKPRDSNRQGMNKNFISYPAVVKDDREGTFLQNLKQNKGIISKPKEDFDRLPSLKSRYPFFLAFHREAWESIGGGDEDFRGSTYDDTDITNRMILSGRYYTKRDIQVLHLYHKRINYQSEQAKIDCEYNKQLYLKRRTQIIRNIGKEWGVL